MRYALAVKYCIFGLQCQFNLLCQFYKMKKLRVKIPKTKVVVFKKGPVLARNEQWTFGGQRLEVVNYFIYLGKTL